MNLAKWVTDWNEIDDNAEYIVCPINARADGSTYLAQPKRMKGWEVIRLKERLYAALLFPEWCPSNGAS